LNCPHCHVELPGGATACPSCKRHIDPDQSTQLYSVADKSRRIAVWVFVASAFVLLLIVAYCLIQSRVTDVGDRAAIDPSIVHSHAPAIESTPIASDSSTSATSDNKPVLGYISFLQTIELRRTALRQSFTSAATGLTVPAPQSNTAASTSAPGGPVAIAAYQQEWLDLVRDYNSQQIPKGCEMLSNNYYRVLQDYVTLIAQMSNGPHTQEAVSSAQSQNQAKIETDALAADQSLQQVCSSAGISKSFQIDPGLAASTAPSATPPASSTSTSM